MSHFHLGIILPPYQIVGDLRPIAHRVLNVRRLFVKLIAHVIDTVGRFLEYGPFRSHLKARFASVYISGKFSLERKTESIYRHHGLGMYRKLRLGLLYFGMGILPTHRLVGVK